MKEIRKTVEVTKTILDTINHHLNQEPTCEDDCLSEDETISVTADFGNGFEMDIKCCGLQYREDNMTNCAWTEAVLFLNGAECCCTEPAESFEGRWELEYEDTLYIADVKASA